jgi:sphinganine-1-phosphate aldolase
MEAEVISMTCNIFRNKEPIGFVTSGGTESILMAMLGYRNRGKAEKGITKPNVLLPVTAHVAFNKACGYYNIETRMIPVDKN